MKILILGGTGLQSESILLDLLEIDTDNIDEITLASRNGEALKKRVETIGNPKVKWEVVDVGDHAALVKLMKRHDLVTNAANTPTVYRVVKAALDAGVNLIGLEGLNQQVVVPEAPADEFGFVKQSFLDQLDIEFKQAGIMGIMGWGYVPGTTNILGRVIGDKFDTIDSMTWYYATASLGDKIFFTETPREMIWLHHQGGVILRDGKYVRINPKNDRETVQFPDPIGEVTVQHMSLMSTVPAFAERYASKNIQNVDVKLGDWPGYIEKMDFLDSVGLLELDPKEINGVSITPADVFLAGPGVANKKGLCLKDYGCVHLVVDGVINGHKVSYVGDALARPLRNLGAMQILTGIPAAIGIQMVIKGELTKKGLYTTLDESINPYRYFEELGRRGYKISITGTEVIVDGCAE